MISREEYYVGASPAPVHDFIHQLLLNRTPVPRRSPVPSVYYVANEVEGLSDVMGEEIE